MPYKDPLVRNARQLERYHNDPDFRLKHYEATSKYNRTKRKVLRYKPRKIRTQRKIDYRAILIELLIERNGSICEWCSKELLTINKLALDHIIAVADGGIDNYSNIRVLHWKCNSLKEGYRIRERTLEKINAMKDH